MSSLIEPVGTAWAGSAGLEAPAPSVAGTARAEAKRDERASLAVLAVDYFFYLRMSTGIIHI